MKCRFVIVMLLVLAFGGAVVPMQQDQQARLPVAQSALIAWGFHRAENCEYNPGNCAGSVAPWWAEWIAFGGVTIGCGFIGLGTSMAATPLVGAAVSAGCDIGISG